MSTELEIAHSLSALPPLDGEAVFKKGSFGERLGERVRNLIFCVNGEHCEMLTNVRSEEVETLVDVFGARSVLGIVGDL